MRFDPTTTPQRRRPPQRALTTTDLARAADFMRHWLNQLRRSARDTVTIERMRPTRTGWAVIYRIGSEAPNAMAVHALDETWQGISPEAAFELWSDVE